MLQNSNEHDPYALTIYRKVNNNLKICLPFLYVKNNIVLVERVLVVTNNIQPMIDKEMSMKTNHSGKLENNKHLLHIVQKPQKAKKPSVFLKYP